MKMLSEACSSGHVDTVKELLMKWIGDVEETQQAEPPEITDDLRAMIKEGNLTTAQALSILGWDGPITGRAKREQLVAKLIDSTYVVWNASASGQSELLTALLKVKGVNVNVAHPKKRHNCLTNGLRKWVHYS